MFADNMNVFAVVHRPDESSVLQSDLDQVVA